MLLVGRGCRMWGAGCGPARGNERGEASLCRAGCLRDPSAARAWPPGHPCWGWAGIQPPLPALGHSGLNPAASLHPQRLLLLQPDGPLGPPPPGMAAPGGRGIPLTGFAA